MRAFALAILVLTTGPAQSAALDPIAAFVGRTLHTSKYQRAVADLNGDGRLEALVYVTDPNFCGTSGCTLLVLSQGKRGYRVVLRTNSQLPVRLLRTSTHGWRDLGVTVSGGGILRAYMARLQFNGRRYPDNPTVPPAIPMVSPSGKLLIGR